MGKLMPWNYAHGEQVPEVFEVAWSWYVTTAQIRGFIGLQKWMLVFIGFAGGPLKGPVQVRSWVRFWGGGGGDRIVEIKKPQPGRAGAR